MSVLFAICCLAAFLWFAADDDDESVSPPPPEPWDTADAFRPGSGRFGWMVCPDATIEED